MSINCDKPYLWDKDIKESIALYNRWYREYAPKAFRETKESVADNVKQNLIKTNYLRDISEEVLSQHPEVLPVLRNVTSPPMAQDRLRGLAGVSANLISKMEDSEKPQIPTKMSKERRHEELTSISRTITELIDRELFVWVPEKRNPTAIEVQKASSILEDRLCSAVTSTIIRNGQEKRQLSAIAAYLRERGYSFSETPVKFNEMMPGTFAFHIIVPVNVNDGTSKVVKIPVDVLVLPHSRNQGDMPILIEAKSAGDFANVNKRRKEEGLKMQQLRSNYGNEVVYVLFLCGYFDRGYLEYEAAEGIDWIWEHRLNDLEMLGI